MAQGIRSYRSPFMGTTHVVASGHYLAAQAGYRILEQGGNAIDAGVASGIAINVTLPHLTSFGGVAPIVLYDAGADKVVTISGLGRWPQAADLDEFTREHGGDIPLGMPRSVVPAACDAWLTALQGYGTMTFGEVVAPSIELAERGFPASYNMCQAIESQRNFIAACPASAETFMPGGTPLSPGQVVVQKDLAQVFRQMAEVEYANTHRGRPGAIAAARDFFYRGDIAQTMVGFCQEQGGMLTMDDFARFGVLEETPQSGTYGDYTLYTCGPWCQGPSLVQILNLLEGYDLRSMGHNSVQYLHTLVEAVKLAFSDRHSYYGDPDLVDVPLAGLLSKEYSAHRRAALDPARAHPRMPEAGDPWPFQGEARKGNRVAAEPFSGSSEPDTSYTCVVDRWGNAFSATPSDSFLTTPIVPGLGMIISGRGSQTWLDPGHPSRLAAWKRPRLTPNPAMVFKDGRPFMPFGTPGGDMQVPAMVQMLLNIVEFGMDTQQAIEAPRARSQSFPDSFWPHTYLPGRLNLEGRIDREVGDALAKLGHDVRWWPEWNSGAGGLCGIVIDRERGILVGGADPRRDSYAVGW